MKWGGRRARWSKRIAAQRRERWTASLPFCRQQVITRDSRTIATVACITGLRCSRAISRMVLFKRFIETEAAPVHGHQRRQFDCGRHGKNADGLLACEEIGRAHV